MIKFLLSTIFSLTFSYNGWLEQVIQIIEPKHKTVAIILISESNEEYDINSIFSLDINEGSRIENHIEILKSLTISELTIKKLNRIPFLLSENKNYNMKEVSELEIRNLAQKLRQLLKVNNVRGTNMLEVYIESRYPKDAALLVNILIDVYIEQDEEWANGEMTHLKTFLEEQLDKKKLELTNTEEELKLFQEREKVFTLDKNSSLLLDDLIKFETEYNNTLASIDIIKEKENYIINQLTSEEKKIVEKVSLNSNAKTQVLRLEISRLESDLISTLTQYGEDHSVVASLKNKLNALKENLQDEIKTLISEGGSSVSNPILYRQSLMDSIISVKSLKASLESKASAFKGLVDEYDQKLSSLPEKMLEFSRLERERTILSETYSLMKEKLEEAKISRASNSGTIRIIDRPLAPKIK